MVWAMQTPRLIALDMDGTLLTPQGQVPERFWQLDDDATAQSITITPASGRQLATLQRMFPACETFIAENGAVVFHNGEVISTTPLDDDAAREEALRWNWRTSTEAVVEVYEQAIARRG